MWRGCYKASSVVFCPYRSANLIVSLVLLVGCYSAILIPAYLPLDREASLGDDYQQPKDLVRIHISEIFFFLFSFFFIITPHSPSFSAFSSAPLKPLSLPADRPLSASLVSEAPKDPGLFRGPPRHPCVRAAGQIGALGTVPASGAPGKWGASGPGSCLPASAWPASITEGWRHLQAVYGGGQRRGSSWEPSWIPYRSVWHHYQVGVRHRRKKTTPC